MYFKDFYFLFNNTENHQAINTREVETNDQTTRDNRVDQTKTKELNILIRQLFHVQTGTKIRFILFCIRDNSKDKKKETILNP